MIIQKINLKDILSEVSFFDNCSVCNEIVLKNNYDKNFSNSKSSVFMEIVLNMLKNGNNFNFILAKNNQLTFLLNNFQLFLILKKLYITTSVLEKYQNDIQNLKAIFLISKELKNKERDLFQKGWIDAFYISFVMSNNISLKDFNCEQSVILYQLNSKKEIVDLMFNQNVFQEEKLDNIFTLIDYVLFNIFDIEKLIQEYSVITKIKYSLIDRETVGFMSFKSYQKDNVIYYRFLRNIIWALATGNTVSITTLKTNVTINEKIQNYQNVSFIINSKTKILNIIEAILKLENAFVNFYGKNKGFENSRSLFMINIFSGIGMSLLTKKVFSEKNDKSFSSILMKEIYKITKNIEFFDKEKFINNFTNKLDDKLIKKIILRKNA